MGFRFVDGPMKTSQALLSHAERRVRTALARVADRVTRVEVHVVDDNGPKGGTDKRCSIVANIAGMGQIAVDQMSSDFFRAVDLAAGKLRRATEHHVARARHG
ncbi:MAG: HPF/RaiA family ribosome-associated protein [Planctomycetes bacterium]|nr:HPF/RaiA family ribosome-associated protein [Planctomycetota bacterium]